MLLKATGRSFDGVLLIRDVDRETDRRKGLEQAREEADLHDRIVIGLRSAKRVLGKLIQESKERDEHCWGRTDLQTLRDRGQETGLTDYLEEVRERLVPVFTETSGP